jgi:hypothetical protein
MTQRRSVEEFDQALLGPTPLGPAQPRTRAVPQSEPGALAALARRIGETGPAMPGISESFRITLRERLVREASALAAAPAPRGRHASRPTVARAGSRGSGRTGSAGQASVWRRRLLAAGIGVAVATGSVGGIAIASAGALPGDPLYTTKKMFENLQLSMSGSPTDQGRQYLKLADTRLTEIDDLLARPDVDEPGSPTAEYLSETLDNLQSAISSGGRLLLGQVRSDDDQTAVLALSDFLQTERQRVLDLSWSLPDSLRGRPAQIVAQMDALTRQLEWDQNLYKQSGPPAAGPTGGAGTGPRHASPASGASGAAGAPGSPGPSTGPSTDGSAGTTGGPTPGASPTDPPSIGITLPLPILPSSGQLNLPPLLPGLPGIDLGFGDGEGNASGNNSGTGESTDPPQK